MIIVINYSNTNEIIKNYLRTNNKCLIEIYKTKKNESHMKKLNFKTKKCNKKVIQYIFNYLKKHNIQFKDIKNSIELIEIIKRKEKVNGIIISGSDLRFGLNEIPYHLILPGLLAVNYFKGKVPIFGICFGFQLINKYFGGEIVKTKNYTNIKYHVEIIDCGHFFKSKHKGTFYFYNNDKVLKLGKGFISTSKSILDDDCFVAAEHKKYKIMGTQFHPELSGIDGYKILDSFLKLCNLL